MSSRVFSAKKWFQALPWKAIRLLIGGILLALIIREIDWVSFLEIVRNIDPTYLVLMFGINLLNLFLSAWRWQILLRADGVETSILRLARYYLLSLFFNNFLPAFVGADAVRMVSVKESKSPGVRVVSVLIERGLGMFVLLAIGGAAILLTPSLRVLPSLDVLILGALAAVCSALVAILNPGLWWPVAGVTQRIPRLYTILEDIAQAGQRYRTRRSVLMAVLVISFLIQSLVVITFYWRAIALHVDVSFGQTIVMAASITPLTLIPITPGGIGTQEAFFTLTYGAIGISYAMSLAMALVARFMDLSMGVLGALVWLRSE